MDFGKVIYENIEKKTFFSQQNTSILMVRHFEVL